ncbi:hypothetical protein KPL74_06855 [Bacillus sp. NP157]|nr:hypothetical protein KPL74_06855 [Bacillus sp. NP157]
MTRKAARAFHRSCVAGRDAGEAAGALTRRFLFLIACLLALGAVIGPDAAAADGLPPAIQKIEVKRLAGQGDALPVSVGIPFPPGMLKNADDVHIVDAYGNDVPAAIKPMLTWHFRDGSIRAVRAQFRATQGTYYFTTTGVSPCRSAPARDRNPSNPPCPPSWPYPQGLIKNTPAAIATLTPDWLTASLIAGPQSVAGKNEPYAAYVDAQFHWARELPVKDTTAWLFDRPSTLFKAYVRTGRADYLAAAEESYRWYMAGIKRDGIPASPSCAGGWLPDEKPCDVKYVYIEPILLAMGLAGDDSMHDADTVSKMADLWASGGWNTTPGAYRAPNDYFTERLAGLGLIETVAAYELTGAKRDRERVEQRVGWLYDHQRKNPDGLGDDGSWRNSWNVHENDPHGTDDVRGASPWMSENIIDGLWHAWLVTGDARIPPMIVDFGRYLERYGWIASKELVSPHNWRNDCSGPDGQIAWYWSSSHAPAAAIAKIQESEGWYSDGHTVELGLPVAAARYFETDPARAAALQKRFEAIAHSYSPSCAAISDTLRRFNWNNRGAGVAQWMMAQPAGAGLKPGANPVASRGASAEGHSP